MSIIPELIGEVEAGESKVQGPSLCREFEATLGYVKPCLDKTKTDGKRSTGPLSVFLSIQLTPCAVPGIIELEVASVFLHLPSGSHAFLTQRERD